MNSTSDEYSGPAPRTGRRRGDSGTRDAIAAAARRQFAAQGYDRTTIRSVAREAGVDPALVLHFFSSKQGLFVSVIELPIDPARALPAILAGDRAGIGRRFAELILNAMGDEAVRSRAEAMIRAAVTEPEAARLLRDVLSRELYGPVAEALGGEDAELRANLVGSQVVGLLMARYIVAVEPLASADTARLVEIVAPTLQRYLTEPL